LKNIHGFNRFVNESLDSEIPSELKQAGFKSPTPQQSKDFGFPSNSFIYQFGENYVLYSPDIDLITVLVRICAQRYPDDFPFSVSTKSFPINDKGNAVNYALKLSKSTNPQYAY